MQWNALAAPVWLKRNATLTGGESTKHPMFCIRRTMKDKEKHKPKNSLLCGICMQDFFFLCLFLLSIIVKIYSCKSSSWLYISPTTLTHKLKDIIFSHRRSKGEEMHLNVRGALLVRGRGHNNNVLICYMDFVWSCSQRQQLLAWCGVSVFVQFNACVWATSSCMLAKLL